MAIRAGVGSTVSVHAGYAPSQCVVCVELKAGLHRPMLWTTLYPIGVILPCSSITRTPSRYVIPLPIAATARASSPLRSVGMTNGLVRMVGLLTLAIRST